MADHGSVLAVIPARAGSKGLPGKNIIDFHGRPLIEWTIRAARESGCCDTVLVSTDGQDIADKAIEAGAFVPWLRPAHLSDDKASSISVVLHALEQFPARTVILLQPTSPLRTATDISACFDLHVATGRPVVSVSPAKPWLFAKAADGRISPALEFAAQRQDAEFVAPNGAVYVFDADYLRSGRTWWEDAVAYTMPVERSIDIDTPHDLAVAKALFA
ncbi:cytidylyltransferase domain-containing protein [Arvimicrobium flavum]|uniref:acylneuraminate cytidylyltransferase family protein n=1 Tax=Arvimicrobium flavum TaxID=3393320 RepID=UPI00237AD002|nr:acylneuraminate cytidylyltransferase family protein [Mesorhizobium shangrilense]